MWKKIAIIVLIIVVAFILFGRERLVFNLDKIKVTYLDNDLIVTIVGNSGFKWSHSYEVKDSDLYIKIYNNHFLSPNTDYEGAIYRFTIPTNGEKFDNIYTYDLFYNKVSLNNN